MTEVPETTVSYLDPKLRDLLRIDFSNWVFFKLVTEHSCWLTKIPVFWVKRYAYPIETKMIVKREQISGVYLMEINTGVSLDDMRELPVQDGPPMPLKLNTIDHIKFHFHNTPVFKL
jgi:hypothetical protein